MDMQCTDETILLVNQCPKLLLVLKIYVSLPKTVALLFGKSAYGSVDITAIPESAGSFIPILLLDKVSL